MSKQRSSYKRARTNARLTAAQQEARIRAAHAVSLQRTEGLSLTHAAARAGTKPNTVRRYFPRSYTRDHSGRWQVAKADREPFAMTVISTEHGPTTVTIRGSKARSLAGRHHSALDAFLAPGGDPAVLAPFAGKRVGGLTLETDPDVLLGLWSAGQFDFLERYAHTH